jgi:hypothetical protein
MSNFHFDISMGFGTHISVGTAFSTSAKKGNLYITRTFSEIVI